MSNVIKTKEDLLVLKEFYDQINKKEITKPLLEDLINEIAPKKDNIQLIKPIIFPKGKEPAFFCPPTRSVNISMKAMEKYIKSIIRSCVKVYDIKDEKTFENYLYLYVALHEIEHSYQFLMGQGIIEVPNSLIKDGYREIFNLSENSKNIFQKIQNKISDTLYNKYWDSLIIERNAQVEADDALWQLAELKGQDNMYKFFLAHKNLILKDGYQKNKNGSLEETYRKILMYHIYKNFDKNIECTEEERIRLGLAISEEARQKVLSLPTKPKDIRKF